MRWPYEQIGVLTTRAFRNLLNKIHGDIAADMQEHKDRADNIQAQINNLVADGDSSPEAAQARVGADGTNYTTLKQRLDTENQSVTSQLAEKANLDYVAALVSSLSSGGPKDLFYTLDALQSAYPNGTDGTFLVLNVDPNGAHTFIWDSLKSAWVDLGIYQGIKLADNAVEETNIQDGAVAYSKLKFRFAYILLDNCIEVNFNTKQITVKDNVFISNGNGGNYSTIPYNYGSIDFPPDYSKGRATYKAWVDLSNMTIKMDVQGADSGNNPILFLTYNGKLTTASPHAFIIINDDGSKGGKLGDNVLSDKDRDGGNILGNSIQYADKIKAPMAYVLGGNNILEVNFKDKKLYVKNSPLFLSRGDCNYAPNIPIGTTIDFPEDFHTGWTYIAWVDTTDFTLHMGKIGDNTKYPILFLTYGESLFTLSPNAIYAIDSNGNKIGGALSTKSIVSTMLDDGVVSYDKLRYPMAYMLSDDCIEVNFQTRKINIKSEVYIVKGNGYYQVHYPSPPIDFPSDYSAGGATYKAYYDITNGVIKMSSIGVDTGNNPILFLTYNYHITTASPNAIYAVDINGQRMPKLGITTDTSTEFDWSNDQIVLPKDLYLVKDVEYSINAQNIHAKKFTDDDRILNEIVIPGRTVAFENNGTVRSPLALANFKTLFTSIYKGNVNNAKFKELTIHIADPSTKTNKSPRILYIGDSITFAGIASLTNIWLKSFGFNPSFIGTRTEINEFGYGIPNEDVTWVNSEGMSGWRLTDVTNTSKDINGNPISKGSNNKFLNPATGTFDFNYYMTQNGFDGVDFVVIMLGTNDLLPYPGTDQGYYAPSLDEVLAYMPTEMQKIVDSILAYDPNIKIGLNPPIPSGTADTLNERYMQYALKMMEAFEGKGQVDILSSYIGSGRLSGKAWNYYIYDIPDGQKSTSGNAHDNGANELISALWSASWIVNKLE
ncbi:hypothetical protein P9695_06690 [Weizmannia sp. CD-2023]|uniref:hypothetical protein n=1 Tax=Heyndrickxia TaxID=2837504 RepID=UPI002E210DAB|nr:hypothetical protein [Weizmannia sp. CD-2023]MED4900744.1 hypothetical protein [Weizmannia sp. CD-2023]